MTAGAGQTVGSLLRRWREYRRLSQFELSMDIEISSKHLSAIEHDKVKPTREVLLCVCDRLDVPFRQRNSLLATAGYEPAYSSAALEAPSMSVVRSTLRSMLGTDVPAFVVDHDWNVVERNEAASVFTLNVPRELLRPPVNALRIALHPRGLAPDIINLHEWRAHILERLRRRIRVAATEQLRELHDEISGYECNEYEGVQVDAQPATLLCLRRNGTEVKFLKAATRFGTALDVTLSELTVESYFPVDDVTRAVTAQFAR